MSAAFEIPGYVDVEQIGEGGFGRVFRARQPAFDRTVAVKLLNGRLDDAATVRRFQRECQALGAVSSHPNIVPVYDAGGTPDGRPYLVMDFVRGGSLADRLASSGPLPWTDVAAIGVKLAGALASAHSAGVLHRDIKPENILVSGYGEPQLADFGIAQRAGIENRTTTAAAMTPSHTAPEQFAGGPPSEATDVYALASTLFTLLAGRTPYAGRPGESVFALMARAAADPVPDLRPLGVPDPLARAVERGLSKDASLRPATAPAFGELLQQAQEQLQVPVTPMPVAQDDGPVSFATGLRAPTGSQGATGSQRPTGWPAAPFDPSATRFGPQQPAPVGSPPYGSFPPEQQYPQQYPPQYAPQYAAPGHTGPGPQYPPGPAPQYPPGPPPQQYPAGAQPPGEPPAGPRRRRGLWLVAAAAVLAVAVAVGVAFAATRGNERASASGPSASVTTPTTAGSAPASSSAASSSATTSSAGSSTSASTSATGTGLDALLLQPGQDPLTDWSSIDASLIPVPDSTEYFCNRTIAVSSAQKSSATMANSDASRVFIEQLFEVGSAAATKAMSDLRASASCGSWNGGGGKDSVAPGQPVQAGDDSVAYATTTPSAQAYQVFFRRGGYFCVITVGAALGSTLGAADSDLAARAASAAAGRLAGG